MKTNQRGITTVVDINQIRIQIQMLVLPHLHCSIRGLLGPGARRERHLGEHSIGGQIDFREGLGGELRWV